VQKAISDEELEKLRGREREGKEKPQQQQAIRDEDILFTPREGEKPQVVIKDTDIPHADREGVKKPPHQGRTGRLDAPNITDQFWSRNVPLSQKLNGLQIKYNADTERFFIVKPNYYIRDVKFSSQLGYALGFEGKEDFNIASHPPDLKAGIHHLYVYTKDLTENIVVGDRMASLLRVVTIRGEHNQVVEETFDTPIMSRVVPREITEIEIEVRSAEGRLVPFEWGSLIIVLVFKKAIYL
jgi:hypothetical protein